MAYNNTSVNFKILSRVVIVFLIFVFGASMVSSAVVANDEREVAVITRFGKVERIVGAGWHFKIPLISDVIKYRTDVATAEAIASSATRDQQSVTIKVSTNYRVNEAKVDELYRTVKDPSFLNESIIPPIIQEAIKSVSARYSAEELLESRDQVKIDITEALNTRLASVYYINIVTVNIEDLQFSPQFDQAIEQKAVAQQEVERRKQELEREKITTEIAGEKAKQTAIEGAAIRANPEILQQQFLQKWDGKLPLVNGQNQSILDLQSLINTQNIQQ